MRLTNRRHHLGLLCATSIGIVTDAKSVFWFRYEPLSAETLGIPKQWVDLKGISVLKYATYIYNLKLKNITPRMVLAPHFKSRRGVINDIPPKHLWKNLKPTLRVLDSISNDTGLIIKDIISAYRSPKYNRAVRGKSKSYHLTNQAIDVNFKNCSTWKASRTIKSCRDKESKFKGGIGRYGTFIHIDTRGYNVDW